MIFGRKLYGLTHSQKSIWNIAKFHSEARFVNIAFTVGIHENVDFDLLNKAINNSFMKNDAMRMRIVESEDGPRQYFEEFTFKQHEILDFNYPDGPFDMALWEKKAGRERIEMIDSPLYDFKMIRISDNEGGFFARVHHIAADAWSLTLLVRQILKCYIRLRDNGEAICDEGPSFIDHIISESEFTDSERFRRDQAFWEKEFDGSYDMTGKAFEKVPRHTGAQRERQVLPPVLASSIMEFGKAHGVSQLSIMMSVLAICIWKMTGRTDVVIGTPVLNRSGAREKNMMGMFVNTIPFRVNVDPDMDFLTFAKNMNSQWKSLLRHQKYPCDLVLKRFREINAGADRLFDIMLSYQNGKVEVYDIDHHTHWLFNGSEVNSLSIHVNDREETGTFELDYDYSVDVLDRDDVARIHEYMATTLGNALREPHVKLSGIKVMSPSQEHELVFGFNDTEEDYPKDETLVSLFEKQVGIDPNKTAVVFEGRDVSYVELHRCSNQLAVSLRDRGVERGSIVGLLADRSVEMVVAMLGIMKAGGAYVTIDTAYPADRIAYMIEDSSCRLLLTHTGETNGSIPFGVEAVDLGDMSNYAEGAAGMDDGPLPGDLAYIIYTSGSTGNPKGVMVEHRGLVNLCHSFSRMISRGNGRVAAISPSCFDMFFVEAIFPLVSGMTVILANQLESTVPYLLLELLDAHKVDFLQTTPSRMKLLLGDSNAHKLGCLTEIILGGERFPEDLYSRLREVTDATIFNGYGPTETSVCTSIKRVTDGNGPITIGKPISNTRIYILDSRLEPVPVGSKGEIFIGGDGLARGYMNNEELTRQRFIDDPFVPGTRMYRTGDVARFHGNGEIEFIGRNDDQVKLRGLRIELGEIENRLKMHDLLEDAIVEFCEDSRRRQFLCAYVVKLGKVSSIELREHLEGFLPEYMIPAHFMELERIPLTPNGKVDFRSLPDPAIDMRQDVPYAPPRNELERTLAGLWEEALEVEGIGIDDDFFGSGGDSLAILEVLSGLYPNDCGISVQDFYEYPTIRSLSEKSSASRSDFSPCAVDWHPAVEASLVPDGPMTNVNSGDILLTGATGFLGIHILYELIEATEDKIYCLIRGEDPEGKLQRLMGYYFPWLQPDPLRDRVCIVSGDITRKNFGMPEDAMKDLVNSISRVIHTAALVSHYGDYEEFHRINVRGTQEVMDFCSKNGKKLNHISTMSVSGNYRLYDREMKPFTEKELYIGQDFMSNVYVRTKFESENMVLGAVEKGLNATILRIGALTGRSSDGQFQVNIDQNAFYRQLKSILMLRHVPEDFIHTHMEFTPVDCCAKAVVNLIQAESRSMPVYHVFNHKTITVGKMITYLQDTGESIGVLAQSMFDDLLASTAESSSGKEIVSGLITSLSQGGSLGLESNMMIDSSLTLRELERAGFEWPEIKGDYIASVISHMMESGFLPIR